MTADDVLREMERNIRRKLAELRAELCESYDKRDWAALGYPSWEAYLAAEFGPFAEHAARMVAEAKR
jgi:hypothetical protein